MTLRSLSVQVLLTVALSLLSGLVCADNLILKIQGLKNEDLIKNVEAHFGSKWVSATSMASRHRRSEFLTTAEENVARSLRPFGYYFPQINSSLKQLDEKSWQLELQIDPGQAVKVRNLNLEVKGAGSGLTQVRKWKSEWPLLPGTKLDQQTWTKQKDEILNLVEDQGYLAATFESSSIELDLTANMADLILILDTGARAVMGDIVYQQDDIVQARVLDSLQRFEKGDFYLLQLVDKLRSDLWRTGYFKDIDVVEQRRLDQSPPIVDFKVALTSRKKNTHQGSVGYGTDSQIRTQYSWQRHLLSDRGDSLGIGLGWQQNNDELQLAGEYRLPRQTRTNQYWSLGGGLKTVSNALRVESQKADREPVLFSGRVQDLSVRLGKIALRDTKWGNNPIVETLYVEGLRESTNYRDVASDTFAVDQNGDPIVIDDVLFETSNSITLGINWDWAEIDGKKFKTSGHHEKAWLFTANDIWGSDREFSQAYISSRHNFLLSDHWKLLVRAEAGYTDAAVRTYKQRTQDDVLSVSITELPSLYRFKAGGSRSVRGYGFEELSNNNIGSNHVLTASAEIEYHFVEDWSLAAFYDIGNAFNDWNKMDLKSGIGVGVRWYTLAGAIRVDVAQAQDLAGKPWQFHLTIGTPLL